MNTDRKMEQWRSLVVSSVRNVADETFQRRAWFGRGPEQSSPDEVISDIFDNANLELFLKTTELTDKQQLFGHRLLEILERFVDKTPQHLVPIDVIDDPEWIQVRLAAESFLDSLGQQQNR